MGLTFKSEIFAIPRFDALCCGTYWGAYSV